MNKVILNKILIAIGAATVVSYVTDKIKDRIHKRDQKNFDKGYTKGFADATTSELIKCFTENSKAK